MQMPTTHVTVDTPYGKLYIAVTRADEHSYHDSERGNVTDLRPMLWASTTPEFEADPDAADHWTIRGRAYAVQYRLFFEQWPHTPERWHVSTDYSGGFRADHGGKVDVLTKTWDLMWGTLTTALDAFAEQHPHWTDLSVYLYHSANMASEMGKADDARTAVVQHTREAGRHGELAAAAAVPMPAAMLDWITN